MTDSDATIEQRQREVRQRDEPARDESRRDEVTPDAGVGAPPRHYPIDERSASDPDNPLPPNPNADTAYGPVRGVDPAHPDSSE